MLRPELPADIARTCLLELQLKIKLSQLETVQMEVVSLRLKVSALMREHCQQQCEATAQQVMSDAVRRDKEREAALARAKQTENDMAAKISSLEAALLKRNQDLESYETRARFMKAEIERINADKAREAAGRRAAEDLAKQRTELQLKSENHAAELHAVLARARQEAEGAIHSYKER